MSSGAPEQAPFSLDHADRLIKTERSVEMVFDITKSVQRLFDVYRHSRYKVLWVHFTNFQLDRVRNDVWERAVNLEMCARKVRFFRLRSAFAKWKASDARDNATQIKVETDTDPLFSSISGASRPVSVSEGVETSQAYETLDAYSLSETESGVACESETPTALRELERSRSCGWLIVHRMFGRWYERYKEASRERSIEQGIMERSIDMCARASYVNRMRERTAEIENRRQKASWRIWATRLMMGDKRQAMKIEHLKMRAGPAMLKLASKCLVHNRLACCVEAKNRANLADLWMEFSDKLLCADDIANCRKKKAALNMRDRLMRMCRDMLLQYRRNRLNVAKKKLEDVVEESELTKCEKKWFNKWLTRFRVNQEMREVVRDIFADAVDQHMMTVAHHAALTIQELFRRGVNERKMNYRLLERCFVVWRASMIKTKIECPAMSCFVELSLDLNVAKFVNVECGISACDVLLDVRSHQDRLMEKAAKDLALESCQLFNICLPQFNLNIGRRLGVLESEAARKEESDARNQERMSWIDIAGQNTECDLLKPLTFLSKFATRKEQFIRNKRQKEKIPTQNLSLKKVVKVICDVNKCVRDFGKNVVRTMRRVYFFGHTEAEEDDFELPQVRLCVNFVALDSPIWLKNWKPKPSPPRKQEKPDRELGYHMELSALLPAVVPVMSHLPHFAVVPVLPADEARERPRGGDNVSLRFQDVVSRIIPSNEMVGYSNKRNRSRKVPRHSDLLVASINPLCWYRDNALKSICYDSGPMITKSSSIFNWTLNELRTEPAQVLAKLRNFRWAKRKNASSSDDEELDLPPDELVHVNISPLLRFNIFDEALDYEVPPVQVSVREILPLDWSHFDFRDATPPISFFELFQGLPVKRYRYNIGRLVTPESPVVRFLFPSDSANPFDEIQADFPAVFASLRAFQHVNKNVKKKRSSATENGVDLDVGELVHVDVTRILNYVLPSVSVRVSLRGLAPDVESNFGDLVSCVCNKGVVDPILTYRCREPGLEKEVEPGSGHETDTEQVAFVSDLLSSEVVPNDDNKQESLSSDSHSSIEEETRDQGIDLSPFDQHLDVSIAGLCGSLGLGLLSFDMGSVILEEAKVHRHRKRKPKDRVRKGIMQRTDNLIQTTLDDILGSLLNIDIGAAFPAQDPETDREDTPPDDADLFDLTPFEESLDTVLLSLCIPDCLILGSYKRHRRRRQKPDNYLKDELTKAIDTVFDNTLGELVQSIASIDIGATTPVPEEHSDVVPPPKDDYEFGALDFVQSQQADVINAALSSSLIDHMFQFSGSILAPPTQTSEEEEIPEVSHEDKYVMPNFLQSLLTTDFLASVLPTACTSIDLPVRRVHHHRKHRSRTIPYTMPNYVTTFFNDATASSLADITMVTIETPFI